MAPRIMVSIVSAKLFLHEQDPERRTALARGLECGGDDVAG
jgi:hypothetical protein